jgi:hypothetical protein
MARKRYKPEEIVAKLRQVDVLVSQGQAMADAIRQIAQCRGRQSDRPVRQDARTLETVLTMPIIRRTVRDEHRENRQ